MPNDAITVDYKKTLANIQDALKFREYITIENIRLISDVRVRAIAVMLYGGISIGEIAVLLKKSKSQIYRIVGKESLRRGCRIKVEMMFPALE